MAKRADTSGLNAEFVISQAKPENRVQGNAPTPYNPSASEPPLNAEPAPESAPVPAMPSAAELETEPQREIKEPPKRKRGQAAGYKDTFLKRNEMKTRQCVYISYDVHDKIVRLVRALLSAGNEISVGGYIDTVLAEHLQANKDEINEVYREGQGDLL